MQQGYIPPDQTSTRKNKKKRSWKNTILIVVGCLLLFASLPSIFNSGSKDEIAFQHQPKQTNVVISASTASIPTQFISSTDIPAVMLVQTTQETIESTDVPTISPTYTAAPIRSPLKKGDRGEEVKALQNRLIELGYLGGAADGDFGNETRASVIDFQKRNGLDADGVAGDKTFSLLYSDSAKQQIWVWIPTDGGKKYHSHSSCSNMNAPKRVTLNDALEKGFDACGKCY